MKKKYTAKLLATMAAGIFLITSCNNDSSGKKPLSADHDSTHVPGTETAIDKELADLLKPVNQQVISTLPVIRAQSGTRITNVRVQGVVSYDTRSQMALSSRTAGRIEKLYVKYNFQPVKKGQLIMELYSPDLAAAQREFLLIRESGPDNVLLEKSRQRLLLLGMTAQQVSQVAASGKIVYRIPVYSNSSGYILEKSASASQGGTINMTAPGGTDAMGGMNEGASSSAAPAPVSPVINSPVLLREGQYVNAGQSLFVIYKNDKLVAEFSFQPEIAKDIRRGQRILFSATADPDNFFSGTIGLIQPVFNAGQNFTLARVYFKEKDLSPGQLLTANIPLVREGYWLPGSAVLDLGTRSILFKKSNGSFIPVSVKTGIKADDMVQVEEDINDWEIAANAAYLVDSESFIKAAKVEKEQNK